MKIKCPDCELVMQRDAQSYRCGKCGFQLEIEENLLGELKNRLRQLKSGLSGLSLRELKQAIADPKNPATAMLINFLAWGVTYFLRFPILMAVLFGISILLGPWGVILMIVLPLVYRAHREAISREVERLAEDKERPTR